MLTLLAALATGLVLLILAALAFLWFLKLEDMDEDRHYSMPVTKRVA